MSLTTAAHRHPANRLARERSPYLLQHAHNPVDWFPWGQGAFSEARRRNVPIFLSVGYSTCYWCHVMERESFEDDATAKVMNECFVNIKVDREERPEVDDLYMSAVQMLTGSGGWPMSVFLDPVTLAPFWGGTYFPPRAAFGRPSFTDVCLAMSAAWRERPEEVRAQAQTVAAAVREKLADVGPPALVGPAEVERAVSTLLTIFDRTHGGFGGAPKFPQPVYLRLLLDARTSTTASEARAAIDTALRTTLDRMALGGIFDQLAGGFHRYSVDALWLVPHFEKMLYDNAQLLTVYEQAAKIFGQPFYADVARRIVRYLQVEMTDPETGMFFTAQDAEVDGKEGLNYVWTRDDVAAVLSDADAAFAGRVFGLDAGANFQDPHHPDEPARNVLRLEALPDVMASRLSMTPADFASALASVWGKLLQARQQRKQPRLDDKIVLSWNAMMIEALALAGASLDEPSWIDMARRAADAVNTRLRHADGSLARCARRGAVAESEAGLEDYASLALAFLALHRVGDRVSAPGRQDLATAIALLDLAHERFHDASGGKGYFDTRDHRSDLFVRARSTYDGAIASSTSMMLDALDQVHELTGQPLWRDRLLGALAAHSPSIAESSIATANATRVLLRMLRRLGPAVRESLAAIGARPVSAPQAAPGVRAILASEERVLVADDAPAQFSIRIELDDGYHINDAAAGEASGGKVLPLRVGLRDGDGLKIYCDCPDGTAISGASHRVLSGIIEMPVVIEKVGAVTQKPVIVVTLQPCNDTHCLAPMHIELQVEIEVDGTNETPAPFGTGG
ncbi:MAG: thioredoxin domain-containing protein [Phycisphaerales bacterium]|jgi:uncharacterized protein YyaL (SSP411 family)|nr:thioredoxin domain-containing protein [Phycisphaeraceae bacterium]